MKIDQDQMPADLATGELPDVPGDAAATAPATALMPDAAARPADVPDKFWDAENASLRTDALLKSYLELERRLGAGEVPSEASVEERADDATATDEAPVGPDIPASPDDYEIDLESDVIQSDPDINHRLHEAGFTQEQARLVYRLAEEYLLPAVSDAYGEVVVQQELHRLEQAFGGAEDWQNTAAQLRTWGQANLDDGVYETLAASYDGVMAMHAMMQAREPQVVHADTAAAPADEASLRRMMQDPRYWRDRDPGFIADVTRGFERLFKS